MTNYSVLTIVYLFQNKIVFCSDKLSAKLIFPENYNQPPVELDLDVQYRYILHFKKLKLNFKTEIDQIYCMFKQIIVGYGYFLHALYNSPGHYGNWLGIKIQCKINLQCKIVLRIQKNCTFIRWASRDLHYNSWQQKCGKSITFHVCIRGYNRIIHYEIIFATGGLL